jgi:hypothetical protein
MNETLAFYAIKTVPAFPLGQPEDGRPRYGMTPEQARVYRWLVLNRPHDCFFHVHFREMRESDGKQLQTAHEAVEALLERGWLERNGEGQRGGRTEYRFVHPVMLFRAPRNG